MCLRFNVTGEMICYIKITYYVNVGKITQNPVKMVVKWEVCLILQKSTLALGKPAMDPNTYVTSR